MGATSKLFVLGFTVMIALGAVQIYEMFRIPAIKNYENTWWGPGKPTKEDTSIKPYKIHFSDEGLKDFQQRLGNARPFTPPLEGIQQQYGMNTNLLKEIVTFWKTKYNWRERETFLNQYPQFTTSIQGLELHFLHIKPSVPKNIHVYPLLLLHGWPGTVREFYEIIPLLTTPQSGRDFVFELVVPSLPGYGFSQGAAKPGLGMIEMAVVFKNLMRRLNYDQYFIQGGDWGGLIVGIMGTLYPDKVIGMHSNMCTINSPWSTLKHIVGSLYPALVVSPEKESRLYPISSFFSKLLLELGYFHIQATKPDTIGVALNESPVGLAAYILEKFTTWTHPEWQAREDGGLLKKFDYTKLLDNVMIYWISGSITTSVRLYSESINKRTMSEGFDRIPVQVPSACAVFPHEIMYQPESFLKERYTNLVQYTELSDGGHFAAFEVPKILAEDIFSAVPKMLDARRKTN